MCERKKETVMTSFFPPLLRAFVLEADLIPSDPYVITIGKERSVSRALIGSSRPQSQSDLSALVGCAAVYALRFLGGLLDFYA